MRIVFHNQQDRVVRLKIIAIVRDLLDWMFRHNDIRQLNRQVRRGCFPIRQRQPRCGRSNIRQRQIQRERAALAGRAAKLNLAAQQASQFTADGQAQARASVFTAGAGICLLEGLEDDALFVESDSDAGIRDLERND